MSDEVLEVSTEGLSEETLEDSTDGFSDESLDDSTDGFSDETLEDSTDGFSDETLEDSTDGFSDETVEEADVDTLADVETSGDTSVDAELDACWEMTADVCVVDTRGTVVAATDTGVTLVVDTWVAVTVIDFPGDDDDDVVTVGDGAGVAVVEAVTGGGILAVLSAVLEVGVEEFEGAAPAGAVTLTTSVGDDAVTVTVVALTAVVTLADVVEGEGVQTGTGFAEATEALVTFALVVA